ncbi:MAG: hypothetical protein ABIY37_01305 [Devosia sp.]
MVPIPADVATPTIALGFLDIRRHPMADTTLTSNWSTPATIRRPDWLATLTHRAEAQRRRARRDRYLAIAGRPARRYPWFETLFTSMSGR